MSIRCAHCKERHASVSEVRRCAGVAHPTATENASWADTAGLAKPTVSAPAGTTYGPKDDLPFPMGSYAIVMSDGKLHFFQVQAGKNRWEGYIFLKEQASDELYAVKSLERRNEIYALIEEDPEGAMLGYGREIGRCGHCGRTLTNQESRDIGIGPVCRGKVSFR